MSYPTSHRAPGKPLINTPIVTRQVRLLSCGTHHQTGAIVLPLPSNLRSQTSLDPPEGQRSTRLPGESSVHSQGWYPSPQLLGEVSAKKLRPGFGLAPFLTSHEGYLKGGKRRLREGRGRRGRFEAIFQKSRKDRRSVLDPYLRGPHVEDAARRPRYAGEPGDRGSSQLRLPLRRW